MPRPIFRRPSAKKSVSLMRRADWDNPDVNWLEEHIQAAIIIHLRQTGAAFEVGMEGVRLSKAQRGRAKVQGMDAGKADIKILLEGGRTIHVELKRKGGRVSSEQSRWHDKIRSMGFEVHVVFASCPTDGVDQVRAIIEGCDQN